MNRMRNNDGKLKIQAGQKPTTNTRLKSRTPFRNQCDKLSPSDHRGIPKTWTINSWNSRWSQLCTPIHRYIISPSMNPISQDIHMHCWCAASQSHHIRSWSIQTTNVQSGLNNRSPVLSRSTNASHDCPITRYTGDIAALDIRVTRLNRGIKWLTKTTI